MKGREKSGGTVEKGGGRQKDSERKIEIETEKERKRERDRNGERLRKTEGEIRSKKEYEPFHHKMLNKIFLIAIAFKVVPHFTRL